MVFLEHDLYFSEGWAQPPNRLYPKDSMALECPNPNKIRPRGPKKLTCRHLLVNASQHQGPHMGNVDTNIYWTLMIIVCHVLRLTIHYKPTKESKRNIYGSNRLHVHLPPFTSRRHPRGLRASSRDSLMSSLRSSSRRAAVNGSRVLGRSRGIDETYGNECQSRIHEPCKVVPPSDVNVFFFEINPINFRYIIYKP